MAIHNLKCAPDFFEALKDGRKTFEIRRNDRKYAVGDILGLRKYWPSLGFDPKEPELCFRVTYILRNEDFPTIDKDFVIMSLSPIPEAPEAPEGTYSSDLNDFLTVIALFAVVLIFLAACSEFLVWLGS